MESACNNSPSLPTPYPTHHPSHTPSQNESQYYLTQTNNWSPIHILANNPIWYADDTMTQALVASLVALYAGMTVLAASRGVRCRKETRVGLRELMRAPRFSASRLHSSICERIANACNLKWHVYIYFIMYNLRYSLNGS